MICCCVFLLPPDAIAAADTNIAKLVQQVNKDTLRSIVQRLQNFRSRYLSYDSCRRAELWSNSYMKAAGLDTVVFDTAKFNDTAIRNTVGTLTGVGRPDSIVVVGGHIDACLWTQADGFLKDQSWAPGADDNGTGSAGVLEIVRVFKKMNARFRYTIKFITFSGEEQWEIGSHHYVDSVAYKKALKIHSMFNIDMIGFHKPDVDSNRMFVTPNTASAPLSYTADSVNRWYSLGLHLDKTVNNAQSGDHTPFWNRGWRGLMITEACQDSIWYGDAYPCYHKACDTIGNIKFGLVQRTIQMVLGTVATYAQLVSYTSVTDRKMAVSEGAKADIVVQPISGGWMIILNRPEEQGRLSLCSIAGRKIAEIRISGTRAFWDGKNKQGSSVPKGIYILRYQSSQQTIGTRIAVVK
jgi:hypothetical protein